MNLKQHIPNLFTLGNLLCGMVALYFVFQGSFDKVGLFVVLGIVLDFFDGFLARVLGVTGELGKQLDSLADMVTSGVVPGFVMFFMLASNNDLGMGPSIAYFGLLLSLTACYRLAKFNIDTRQSDSFIGLPTPAMSLFVVSLPVIYSNTDIAVVRSMLENSYVLIAITLVLSYLMNANLPLLALKFKNFSWAKNQFRWVLILLSGILIGLFEEAAVPLIIILYVLLSVVQNITTKQKV